MKNNKTILKNILLTWILPIVILMTFTFIIFKFLIFGSTVSGHSMNPTFKDGESVVGIYSNLVKTLDRGDIIAIEVDKDEKFYLIKRIMGLPGETVQIKEGYLYINGEIYSSDPFKEDVMSEAGLFAEEVTLKENEYFVLGDNRNNSRDSRYYGPIDYKNIIGKIIKW